MEGHDFDLSILHYGEPVPVLKQVAVVSFNHRERPMRERAWRARDETNAMSLHRVLLADPLQGHLTSACCWRGGIKWSGALALQLALRVGMLVPQRKRRAVGQLPARRELCSKWP